MVVKIRNIFKYISLISLLAGVGIWVWYILFIIIMSKTPYGEILYTVPIGILGVVSGLISRNLRLLALNTIQTFAFPVLFFIASIQEAIKSINS